MPDIFNNGSKPLKPSLSTNTILQEPVIEPVDEGDPRSLGQKIQDGWNDFVGRLTDYFDQSQVGNVAQSEMMNPETTEAVSMIPIMQEAGIGQTTTNDVQPGTAGNSNIYEATQGTPSLAQYVQDNPDLSAEEYMQFMAQHSDEWAEKWIDYALEKQSIDDANAYTASREDTAYQRLVEDLKRAGLNPAMMYGSSAGTSASGSAGVVKASEGANSRSISNYEKIKSLLISYMLANMKNITNSGNLITKGLQTIFSMLG